MRSSVSSFESSSGVPAGLWIGVTVLLRYGLAAKRRSPAASTPPRTIEPTSAWRAQTFSTPSSRIIRSPSWTAYMTLIGGVV